MKKKFLNILSVSSIALLSTVFVGCGGSSSSEAVDELMSGYLIDAPVNNVPYVCGEHNGVTKDNGLFNYTTGDDCSFKIANSDFIASSSKIIDDGYVTPYDITNSVDEAKRLAFVIQNISTKDESGNLTIVDEVANSIDSIDLSSNESVESSVSSAISLVQTTNQNLNLNIASSVDMAFIEMSKYVLESGEVIYDSNSSSDDSIIPTTPPTVPNTTTDDIASYELPGT